MNPYQTTTLPLPLPLFPFNALAAPLLFCLCTQPFSCRQQINNSPIHYCSSFNFHSSYANLYQNSPRKMSSFFIFLLTLLCFWLLLQCSNAHIFTLEMHHRFSEPIKKWSQKTGKNFMVQSWPNKGSVEYYQQLANHDRLLRGRRLSESDGLLTFSDGNSTFRISSLGL